MPPCSATHRQRQGSFEQSSRKSVPLGYVISQDQYFKRDDLGIVYQLNVVPGKQRSLIGATLIKTVFERAAFGCRLFCCWCAQDIEANRFWESLAFIPLAFRSGSRAKGRTHISWQRRIREGDVSTPYWFPAQTSEGSIREDRLVLPIPPDIHRKDVMPVVLPGRGETCLTLAQGETVAPLRKRRRATGPSNVRRSADRQAVRVAFRAAAKAGSGEAKESAAGKVEERSQTRRGGAGVEESVSGAVQWWVSLAAGEVRGGAGDRRRRCEGRPNVAGGGLRGIESLSHRVVESFETSGHLTNNPIVR